MHSFWKATSVADGRCGVNFSSTVQVVNADNTVCIRQMNPDGRFYDAEMDTHDDDEGSLCLTRDDDEDGLTFMDALQGPDSGVESDSIFLNSRSVLKVVIIWTSE